MAVPAWIAALPSGVVKTDLTADAAGGALTYADALQLLTDVEGQGAVTASEFSALQALAANLNNGLTTSDYVASLLTQLIGGSAANAAWTDGGPVGSAAALGNLEAGTTPSQLSELIGTWFLGANLPDPTPPSGSGYETSGYSAINMPLYGPTGAAAVADICQGGDGDCELLAGLIDMVDNHPQQLASMIVADPNGDYGVRFYVGGNEVWVTVNDELPTETGQLVYAHNYNWQNTAIWVSLVEKAYAQLSATGLIDHPAADSYANVSADTAVDVFANLADANVNYYFASDSSFASDKAIYIDAVDSGQDVVLETADNASDTYDGAGNIELVGNHAFAVIGYDSATGDFIVRNPWGVTSSSQNWDAQFEVSLATIASVGGDFAIDNASASPVSIISAPWQVLPGATTPLSGLFGVTDTHGAGASLYDLQLLGGGAINLNGAANVATQAQSQLGQLVVSASDLAKLSLTPASAGATQTLLVSAFDGSSWSATADIQVNVSSVGAVMDPVLGAMVAAGGSVPVSSLFRVSGSLATGDTWYAFIVPNGDGAINLNGAENFWGTQSPGQTAYEIEASQLSLLTFSGPASGGTVTLQAQVYTGSDWTAWQDIAVDVGLPVAAALRDYANGQLGDAASIADSAANVFANLDALQTALSNGDLTAITVTDTTAQHETISVAESLRDAGVLSILKGGVTVSTLGAADDFAGQGHSDVLFGQTSGSLAIWEMSGTAIVGGGAIGAPGGSWSEAGIGDFNGDGRADILFQDGSGNLAIWEMNGTSIIGGGGIGNPGGTWAVVATGDFNGDGASDILFSNASGNLAIWEMGGTSIVGGGAIGAPGGTWAVKGTGDFNGDGKSDILFEDASGNYAIWAMNGVSIIGGGAIGAPGSAWSFEGTGDFNGDGMSDILLHNTTSGDYAIWEMNGTAIIGGGDIGNPGGSWSFAGIGDFNGDGHADILFTDAAGDLAIWEMNGTQIIGGGQIGNPGSAWHVLG